MAARTLRDAHDADTDLCSGELRREQRAWRRKVADAYRAAYEARARVVHVRLTEAQRAANPWLVAFVSELLGTHTGDAQPDVMRAAVDGAADDTWTVEARIRTYPPPAMCVLGASGASRCKMM